MKNRPNIHIVLDGGIFLRLATSLVLILGVSLVILSSCDTTGEDTDTVTSTNDSVEVSDFKIPGQDRFDYEKAFMQFAEIRLAFKALGADSADLPAEYTGKAYLQEQIRSLASSDVVESAIDAAQTSDFTRIGELPAWYGKLVFSVDFKGRADQLVISTELAVGEEGIPYGWQLAGWRGNFLPSDSEPSAGFMAINAPEMEFGRLKSSLLNNNRVAYLGQDARGSNWAVLDHYLENGALKVNQLISQSMISAELPGIVVEVAAEGPKADWRLTQVHEVNPKKLHDWFKAELGIKRAVDPATMNEQKREKILAEVVQLGEVLTELGTEKSPAQRVSQGIRAGHYFNWLNAEVRLPTEAVSNARDLIQLAEQQRLTIREFSVDNDSGVKEENRFGRSYLLVPVRLVFQINGSEPQQVSKELVIDQEDGLVNLIR